MEVILLKNVLHLGEQNDIVNIKPGYARNYLIPNQLAVVATKSLRKQALENAKQQTQKRQTAKSKAVSQASSLEGTTLQIAVKSGKLGKLFGAITATQIIQSLAKQRQILAPPKAIQLEKPIQALGKYRVSITLYPGVKANFNLEVIGTTT